MGYSVKEEQHCSEPKKNLDPDLSPSVEGSVLFFLNLYTSIDSRLRCVIGGPMVWIDVSTDGVSIPWEVKDK